MNNDHEIWKLQINSKLDRLLNDVNFIKQRTAAYLGRNEAITYLLDGIPILVNTDDFGGPLNFLNGGAYEEDYFSVLLSFRISGLPFLDIGSNLGVYTLRMATYMKSGEIHSFEPIPRIRNLLTRSVMLNGMMHKVKVHPFAVSDYEGEARLSVPIGHTGGASIEEQGSNDSNSIGVRVVNLDSYLPVDFVCGMIKIDVEGHELKALLGMRRILERSTEAAVLFEKLSINSGIESDLMRFFSELGWLVYMINGRSLSPVSLPDFEAHSGYFIAALPEFVNRHGYSRDFFVIYPSDLNLVNASVDAGVLHIHPLKELNQILAHGPYCRLPRGVWEVSLEGLIEGSLKIEICENFGFRVGELFFQPDELKKNIVIDRDLSHFELVIRNTVQQENISKIYRFILTRIG